VGGVEKYRTDHPVFIACRVVTEVTQNIHGSRVSFFAGFVSQERGMEEMILA